MFLEKAMESSIIKKNLQANKKQYDLSNRQKDVYGGKIKLT